MSDFIDYSNCVKDSRGVYCASYPLIEEAVGKYLQKFHPEVLIEPTPIPIEEWIESGEYGFSLEYRDISFPSAKGISAFSNMAIWSRDSETNELTAIPIDQNTILIDEALTEPELRFTCCHEVIHTKAHGYYFLNHANAIAANSTIYYSTHTNRPIYWLERQADYGAGALLIPKRTVEILFRQITGKNYTYKVYKSKPVHEELITSVQQIYNTSRTAAKIRLQQLNLIE